MEEGRTLRLMHSLVACLLLVGCAASHPSRRTPWSVFRSARHVGRPAASARGAQVDEGAAVIVDQLHSAGFHFGTDGTPGALWGYLRTAHERVTPDEARAGDIIFFDTRSREDADLTCADRAGVIERVDPGGRITFLEARAGLMRRGYVDPRSPLQRRNGRGEILNSFMRPKRLGDPDGTRYFAGEMLCGVARMRSR